MGTASTAAAMRTEEERESVVLYADCLRPRPCRSNNSRYQASVRAARSGSAVAPQITDSVRCVSGPVLVRWASLTRVGARAVRVEQAEQPAQVDRLARGVEDVGQPGRGNAHPQRRRARSRSTTLIGRPLCSDAMLQASTAALIGDSSPSRTAFSRYSEAGLLRPVGLKPPWRSSARTASRTASSLCSGAAAPGQQGRPVRPDWHFSERPGERRDKARRSRRG